MLLIFLLFFIVLTLKYASLTMLTSLFVKEMESCTMCPFMPSFFLPMWYLWHVAMLCVAVLCSFFFFCFLFFFTLFIYLFFTLFVFIAVQSVCVWWFYTFKIHSLFTCIWIDSSFFSMSLGWYISVAAKNMYLQL